MAQNPQGMPGSQPPVEESEQRRRNRELKKTLEQGDKVNVTWDRRVWGGKNLSLGDQLIYQGNDRATVGSAGPVPKNVDFLDHVGDGITEKVEPIKIPTRMFPPSSRAPQSPFH